MTSLGGDCGDTSAPGGVPKEGKVSLWFLHLILGLPVFHESNGEEKFPPFTWKQVTKNDSVFNVLNRTENGTLCFSMIKKMLP